MKKPTAIERATGNTSTDVVLTVIGVLSGNPISALLPVLNNSLANKRHKERVEEAIRNIEVILEAHAKALHRLSDSQYKLINESILALFQTTNKVKIRYLQYAIQNSLYETEILPQEAVVLSRVIRDISADEAIFLQKNFQYMRVQMKTSTGDEKDKTILSVLPNSREELLVSGLISLGLLTSPGNVVADLGRFSFSPIVAKLLVLLSKPNQVGGREDG